MSIDKVATMTQKSLAVYCDNNPLCKVPEVVYEEYNGPKRNVAGWCINISQNKKLSIMAYSGSDS